MGLPNNLGKLSNMITSTGSAVGIGTTTPNDLLEVSGGFIRLSATAGNGPQFNIYSNGQTSNHVTLAQGFALATDNIGYLYNRANAAFVFGTNNAERMRISATGNVGIGTSSPGQKLVITTSGGSPSINIFDGTSDCYLGIATSANGYANGAAAGDFVVRGASGLAFTSNNGSTTAMRVTSGGYLKVGGNSGSTAHEFYGSINNYQIATNVHTGSSPYGIEVNFANADPNNGTNWGLGFYAASPSFVWIYRIYSNGTVANRSDARWKKNIETTRNGYLEDLCKLRVVKYNWYNHEENAPKELGLIAQEVEEVFPNLVQYDKVITKKQVEQEDGTFIEQEVEDGESRSVKISVLPYMLLKALQEANTKIEELSAKVTALENK